MAKLYVLRCPIQGCTTIFACMNATHLLLVVAAYSGLLFLITWLTARKADNAAFFKGNNTSPWAIVAYGMIGASLSGVTFMSVPGWVGAKGFTYLMMVFGYLAGYAFIATVLLPLYYRLNLTSIYTYLEQRFGDASYKTGAFFFILSRTIGASFRMFLVVNVLHTFVLSPMGVPFWISVLVFMTLILLYTYEGGIKTIIWTDTLQTTFMLLSVVLVVFTIKESLGETFSGLWLKLSDAGYTRMVETDWKSPQHLVKQFFSGMFITIVMTGLDQEMMQKNLSCRSLRDAQKNMLSFSLVLVVVNFMFLFLGGLLYVFAQSKGLTLPAKSDNLFPMIALQVLGPVTGLVFIIGLVSAAYPSADGAITSLTTSVCFDFMGLQKRSDLSEQQKRSRRVGVHLGFAALLLCVILAFRGLNNDAIIEKLFKAAGFTYGPLLGLYAFGLMSKRSVRDRMVPWVAVSAPVLCYVLNENSARWFGGYTFGFEILMVNGLLTLLGLWLFSDSGRKVATVNS
jgi:SSS family solute:Na+ symporter